MPFERRELQTERLLLRPWRLTDIDDVFAYSEDPEWARYLWNVPQPNTFSDVEKFVAQAVLTDWNQHANFAIECDGRAIGGISLYWTVPPENRVASLGYSIGREHWNRGYVTEAASALLRYGFEDAGLRRIFATADARNTGSIRVMQKLGMTQEARLREHRSYRGEYADEVYYGILAREFKALQQKQAGG